MSAATRVDFHSNVPDKLLYACRLVRKARAASAQRILLLLADRQQMSQFDEMLWTFSDIDFLPHVPSNSPLAAQTPVLLTCQLTPDLPPTPILINLSHHSVQQVGQFERIFDIVSGQEEDKLAGRERYRFYQQLGCTMQHFVANLS